MWRVVLSVAAVGYDFIMLALWAVTLPTLLHRGHDVPAHAVVASPSMQHAAQTVNAAIFFFLGVGFVLNLFAIAFGARLPFGRASDRESTAAEFA